MSNFARLVWLLLLFVAVSIAWMVLGGVTLGRTTSQTDGLQESVTELWGSPQEQHAPAISCRRVVRQTESQTEVRDGVERVVLREVERTIDEPLAFASSDVEVTLDMDRRRRGLVWYPLYAVDYRAAHAYVHDAEPCTAVITFTFPDAAGLYDDFRFVVDGRDLGGEVRPSGGRIEWTTSLERGARLALEVGYRSRGSGVWSYRPAPSVASLEDFDLLLRTDFDEIDFPANTLSPTTEERVGQGWNLTWHFDRVVTGRGLGMIVPTPIQPGELASELAFSAPISLFFFFVVVMALSLLRGIDLHPVHLLFLSAAFFAFHLLFAYSADRLPIEAAFALASATSIFLVVTYLRKVVSSRFAFVEAALAQLIYLVGFSAAHFARGSTGITITVLAIVTLFALMQWTAHVKWGTRGSS